MIVRILRIVCDHAKYCPGHGKDAEADLAVYVPPST